MPKERCEHCGRLKFDQHGNEPPHPIEQCRDRLKGHRDALQKHAEALVNRLAKLEKVADAAKVSCKHRYGGDSITQKCDNCDALTDALAELESEE